MTTTIQSPLRTFQVSRVPGPVARAAQMPAAAGLAAGADPACSV